MPLGPFEYMDGESRCHLTKSRRGWEISFPDAPDLIGRTLDVAYHYGDEICAMLDAVAAKSAARKLARRKR